MTGSNQGAGPSPFMDLDLAITGALPRLVEALPGFTPTLVDLEYLDSLGVGVRPKASTLEGLARGSRNLIARLRGGTLIPRSRVLLGDIDLRAEFDIHNYTGSCPTMTYELNPVRGCHVGCLYCLVTDGCHERELVVLRNYAELVARVLHEKQGSPHFYYLSPKTEALQAPTLQTGVVHDILRAFVEHFRRHRDSRARLFVASKGGLRQLMTAHRGETIVDLLEQLGGRVQFNTSICFMPDELRRLLEPYAPTVDERLAAVALCQSRGVYANSALIQPILPSHCAQEHVDSLMEALARARIVNIKPELLTVNPDCLAILGQFVGYCDKNAERRLYEDYLAPCNADHKKQRDRTAPNRDVSRSIVEQFMMAAKQRGMTTSLCAWVRGALGISQAAVPLINRNGFQCLGYQTRLLAESP